MNNNKVMNRAADNIRILAASMVEKAKSGHPGGAMGGAGSFWILDTCLQCYIQHWHFKENLQ